ncbi:hypothetical protein V8C35DRAFT_314061 [Trichoderma chlorosporum]
MDVSYIPHAERVRRKNRSSTNINHLTLAPLTTKLPIDDDEAIVDGAVPLSRPSTSYLQGKSAPTTPRLLASSATNPRSRSRSRNRTPSASGASITKSKSSSHLTGGHAAKKSTTGASTPRRRHDDGGADGDWLLRTGALMTYEAREFKGQSWLVSRQSSTSLTGIRSIEDVAFEDELAREREMTSLLTSRRGSLADDDMSISIIGSKVHSRSHSIHGSRSQLMTPIERLVDESYFPSQESLAGPDFIDLDERLEELERDTVEDAEVAVRRLMRRGTGAKAGWMTSFMGWNLFSVDEHEEETDDESEYDESLADSRTQADRSAWLKRHVEGPLDPEDFVPPPTTDEGSWSDAAWLLSVASKVIF